VTTLTMIDNLIKDALHLSTSDSYVTAEWRPKILRVLQRVVERLYDYDLPWKQGGPDDLTISAATRTAVAPSGFGIVGTKGGVFKANDKEMLWRNPDYLKSWLTDNNSGVPDFYTLYGVDATTNRPLFYFDRAPTEQYVAKVLYEKQRPQLIDIGDATNGLDKIPVEFHEDVIFTAAWEWLALGGGDGRASNDFSARTEAALNRKLARYQHGKEGMEQLGDRGISELQQW